MLYLSTDEKFNIHRRPIKKRTILFLFIFILCIPPTFYRFKNPEKSETQLLLDFFKSYKEFFNIF
jgi:hypothetical protein